MSDTESFYDDAAVTDGGIFHRQYADTESGADGARDKVGDDPSCGTLENLASFRGVIGFVQGDPRNPDVARRAWRGICFRLAAKHGGRGCIETLPVECTNACGERENESHAVIALITQAVARLDPFLGWGAPDLTSRMSVVPCKE